MRFHLSEQRRKPKRYVVHIPFSVPNPVIASFTPALTAFGVLVLSATGKEGTKEVTARVPWRDASAQLGSVPRLAAVLRNTVAPSHTSATTPSDGLPHANVAAGATADARW